MSLCSSKNGKFNYIVFYVFAPNWEQSWLRGLSVHEQQIKYNCYDGKGVHHSELRLQPEAIVSHCGVCPFI